MQKDEIGQRWWDGRVNRAELEHLPNIQYANTSCHLTSWLLTEVEEERWGGNVRLKHWTGGQLEVRTPVFISDSGVSLGLAWKRNHLHLLQELTEAESAQEKLASSGSVQENEWWVTLWRICHHHDYQGPHLHQGQRNSLKQVINSKRNSSAESLR